MRCMAFKGACVLSAGEDRTIRVFRCETAEPLQQLVGHKVRIICKRVLVLRIRVLIMRVRVLITRIRVLIMA